jgi:hypothetical protein
MSALPPCSIMQTLQREFASAKLHKINDIRKFSFKKNIAAIKNEG